MKLNWTEGGGQTKLVWHECFTLLLLQAVSCSCSFCLFGHFLVLLRLNDTFWSVKLSLLCIESVTVWFLHTFFSWASMFAEKYKKKGLKWFQISFVQNLLIALLSFALLPHFHVLYSSSSLVLRYGSSYLSLLGTRIDSSQTSIHFLSRFCFLETINDNANLELTSNEGHKLDCHVGEVHCSFWEYICSENVTALTKSVVKVKIKSAFPLFCASRYQTADFKTVNLCTSKEITSIKKTKRRSLEL